MDISFNTNLNAISANSPLDKTSAVKPQQSGADFKKVVSDYLRQVDNTQVEANNSITDLLSGKNQDVNSVVASVAKADMSFKLLVGVRNKLVEAYKETMKMPV